MLTAKEVAEVSSRKLFNTLLVMRVGEKLYDVYGFRYGVKHIKLSKGSPEDVAEFINGFYGYNWRE